LQTVAVVEEKSEQPVPPTPAVASVPVIEPHFSDVKKTVNGSVVTLEGTYQGKPIRVRIFGEPTPEHLSEKEEKRESNSPEKVSLHTRLKSSLGNIPVEPPSIDRNARHIIFSED
jgi:hypothetical protein